MPGIAQVVLWALSTGLVTGGVWMAIVLTQRQRALGDKQQIMLEDVERRSAALDQLEQRFAEVEERLDFAERMLAEQKQPSRLPPHNQ